MAAETITAAEKRQAVIRKYEEILGRNKYSQPKRSYAFKKYSDGKYYSDCSSSIALAYKYAGYPFYDNSGSYNPNTVGMYQAKSLAEVPVKIKNGVIQNPEILRLCDMLLFAGTDSSRRYAGYVGHVEMVGRISGSKITLYGHGSGTPRATEMNAYCKKRYNQKTSTGLGHKGLIKVVRFFADAGNNGLETVGAELGSRLLRKGSKGEDVRLLQNMLLELGYELPRCGADGDFGSETEAALKKLQQALEIAADGLYGDETHNALMTMLEKCGGDTEGKSTPAVRIRVTAAKSAYVRSGPDKSFSVVGVVQRDMEFESAAVAENGWRCINADGREGWISPKMCQEI